MTPSRYAELEGERCRNGHVRTEENTYFRGSARVCRECNRAAVSRYKKAHRKPPKTTSPRQPAEPKLSWREKCKALNKPCAIDGCTGWALAKGYCGCHYGRLRKHGDPLAGRNKAPDGAGFLTGDGYRGFNVDGKVKREHILVAERAMGKPLPVGAVVHHVDRNRLNNAPTNLVVCPDQTYHMLIHTRMRALEACGHADWLMCQYCKQFDAPENLRIYHSEKWQPKVHHVMCNREHQAKHRRPRGKQK